MEPLRTIILYQSERMIERSFSAVNAFIHARSPAVDGADLLAISVKIMLISLNSHK
jgi:hypothetical protein